MFKIRFFKNRASWPDRCEVETIVFNELELEAILTDIDYSDWYRVDITNRKK